jgi:hypothetical protein
MRRLVSALAVSAGLTLLAGSAQAQERGDYPPTRAGLTVSESTVSPGDRLTVSGGGAEPRATVTFTLKRMIAALGSGRVVASDSGHPRLLATSGPATQRLVSLGSTTDADGQFSATLSVPAGTEPGEYTLTASSGGGFLAAMTLRVMTVSGIGGLPFTGAAVLPGLVTGAALIVAGGLLLLSLRRRRPAA